MVFYKYVSAKRINILRKRLIRFTQPNAMNDPFEARPYFYPEISSDRRDKYYALHNKVGILSLSEIPDNLLMWSHYAEGHTGFVLVLDGSHDFFKGDRVLYGFANPAPVEYRYELPRLRVEETFEEAVMSKIFFVKSLDWKYEKEWRYLKFRANANKRFTDTNKLDINLFQLPPKCIMGVILGCYRSKELENKILTIKRENPEFGHLRIQQARAFETHYSIAIEDIVT